MAEFDKKGYDKYLYKDVVISMSDGRTIKGEVTSFDGEVTSGYGMPTLDIQQDGYLEVVTEDDILDIEII